LPDPSIADPTAYFNTVLYTGNQTTGTAITGVGFQPDFIWIKERDGTASHAVFDIIRGTEQRLRSDTTDAENTSSESITSFDSDGFTVGNNTATNGSGDSLVAWNWKANGSGVSNTDGTITSTVSANTTAGFSIVSYTGNGSANQTVGHGLSVKPELKIIKSRSIVEQWVVSGELIGPADYRMFLQSTAIVGTASNYYPVDTSTTLGISGSNVSNGHNQSSATYIAYCFHSVEGYSKFGTYTPNNSTDGPFIYTGFKPAFVLIKNKTGPDSRSWAIEDNKRDPYNPADKHLNPNLPNAEATSSVHYVDFVSNGFKLRNSHQWSNYTGYTYIYMAFAESPFKYSNAR
jgi:hypothetical protein